MDKNDQDTPDVVDEDLYEEIEEEELVELVEIERQKALQRAKEDEENKKPKRPFPKWAFWLISIAMVFNVFAVLPQTFSIPAIDFLITSAKLSTQEDIQTYKEAVVVIETNDSRGTGFAITSNGTILTNHHVVEGEDTVTVAFPEDGLFQGEVVASYPSVDLAVVETNGDDLPYLQLAAETQYEPNESIYFIGNPLRFQGIANEGTILESTLLSSWEEEVLMIEAPVYRGNSGSPIINDNGEVIGVIFATLNHDNYGRVGLFVPIDYYYDYHGS
ncbi:S1C family serine protease [Oceanobacillus halotolerans]|uniref:S1C family serine protease n=1 Tax=Oceanobacillus halotolerans TaxID=2663380 RepID=UPI0013DAB692|nr:serine protease [Oceanobacillus halotolerans]